MAVCCSRRRSLSPEVVDRAVASGKRIYETATLAGYVAGHFAIILLVAQAGEPFTEREKPLLFGAIALLYLFVGAGRYSLDALIRRRGR